MDLGKWGIGDEIILETKTLCQSMMMATDSRDEYQFDIRKYVFTTQVLVYIGGTQSMPVLVPLMKKIAPSIMVLTWILGLALFTPAALANTAEREKAYQRAKEIMTPDLYLIYRISERIATANRLKRPVRVAVRRGLDCEGTLGISQQSAKCQALGLLSDVDKATNFDIWAAQVVETMKGNPIAAPIDSLTDFQATLAERGR